MKAVPALLALVALAAGVGPTTAQPAGADRPVLSTGPALGGDRVFWGETTPEAMSVLLQAPGAGTQVVYRQRSTSRTQDWGADQIAASPSILAFARSWSDCGGGACGYGGTDVWEGRPRGPFRRFAFAPYLGCASGGVSFDVDGPMIAYSEGFCRRGAQRTRVVLRNLRHGPSVELENAPAKTYCCDAVTMAGHFVAWRAGRAVVVYD